MRLRLSRSRLFGGIVLRWSLPALPQGPKAVFAMALLAFGIDLLATTACRQGARSSAPEVPLRARMAAVLRGVRLGDGRLVGFDYAHRAPGRFRLTARMTREMALLQKQLGRHGSPRGRADLAISKIAAGRFDEAISLLETAIESAPQDPQLLSDLAAMYLTRSAAKGEPKDIFLALNR